jgi:hypothetical protein
MRISGPAKAFSESWAAADPDGAASEARAASSSPRASASRYARTTAAAARENSESASISGPATLVASGAAGRGVAAGRGAFVGTLGATSGAGGCDTATRGDVASGAGAGIRTALGFAAGVCRSSAGVGASDGAALAVASAEGSAVGFRAAVGLGVAVGRCAGIALFGVAVTGASVAATIGAAVAGGENGEAAVFATVAALLVLPIDDKIAPIAKPATTTASKIGIKGNEARARGFGRRVRRRGRSSMLDRFRRGDRAASRDEATARCAKRVAVIRISVPIDVGTIVATACSAFAFATPLRVDALVELAIREALGTRAPHDKRERAVRTTLAGFRAGKFVVDVDGRLYDRPEAVVVATGIVSLRFYSTEPRWRRLRRGN